MSDLSPRGGTRLTRKQRETRAYRLVLLSGGAGVLTVVLAVLAVVGIVSPGLVFILALITAAGMYGTRRTLGK